MNESFTPDLCNWAKDNRALPNAIKSRLIAQAQQAHDNGEPSPTFVPPTPKPTPATIASESLPADLSQRLDDVEELSQAAATTANAVADQSDRTSQAVQGYQRLLDEFKAEIAQLKDTRPKLVIHHIQHPDGAIIKLDGMQHKDFDAIWLATRKMAPERRQFWLAGPAGAGKSYIVKQLAKALNLRMDGYGTILNMVQMVGYTDANANYFPTAFYDFYVNGGVFFLDECDGSIPEAMVALNMALSNGMMSFPRGKNGQGGLQQRHPNFYCYATANTMGAGADAQYARFKQDAAFMDRFLMCPMDYDPTLERMMIEEHAQEWVKVVQDVRDAARLSSGGKSGFVISPRSSERGQDLLRSSGPDDPPATREQVVQMVFGAYRTNVLWPHIGKAAEEWIKNERRNNLNNVDFTGGR